MKTSRGGNQKGGGAKSDVTATSESGCSRDRAYADVTRVFQGRGVVQPTPGWISAAGRWNRVAEPRRPGSGGCDIAVQKWRSGVGSSIVVWVWFGGSFFFLLFNNLFQVNLLIQSNKLSFIPVHTDTVILIVMDTD